MAKFYGSNSDDKIYKTILTSDNKFFGLDGNDQILAGEGNDEIYGGNGNDPLLKGGGGDDLLYGEAGNDVLHGDTGNDYLFGGSGDDILSGGYLDDSGDDYLDGGLGADTMRGGAGNDTYIVDNPGDKVVDKDEALGTSSSGGIDTVFSSVDYSFGVVFGKKEGNNGDGIENLILTGTASSYAVGNSIDNIIQGNNSDNMLFGMDGNDYLYGKNGNDVLSGGDGIDHLFGGDGNDQLIGNDGSDTLTGGLGGDTFYFYSVSHSPAGVSRDKITDFNWLEGDKIDLSEFDVNPLINGNQAFKLSQMSYDSTTGIFTADAMSGGILEIELVGTPAGFDIAQDVIA